MLQERYFGHVADILKDLKDLKAGLEGVYEVKLQIIEGDIKMEIETIFNHAM